MTAAGAYSNDSSARASPGLYHVMTEGTVPAISIVLSASVAAAEADITACLVLHQASCMQNALVKIQGK